MLSHVVGIGIFFIKPNYGFQKKGEKMSVVFGKHSMESLLNQWNEKWKRNRRAVGAGKHGPYLFLDTRFPPAVRTLESLV